ncbi:MAG: hypothetical protein GX606_02510 [Elusimicrobia bacterium]|nr:hypothetical protein [Elusimicrobiota bacterium]
MNKFSNILVVRTDRIGDVVLTTPALQALREAFPNARLTVWTSLGTRELIDGLPFIDEVLSYPSGGTWGYLKMARDLSRRRFDLAVVYHTKRFTNAACFLAGIPYRLGYRDQKFGLLLNHPVRDIRPMGERHETEYCLDLLTEIGVPGGAFVPRVAFQKEAEVWADEFFLQQFPGGTPVVAIHPDASCPTKRWPVEGFAAVADDLEGRGIRTVIIGGKAAKPLALAMRAAMRSDPLDLTGEISLSCSTSLLKRCRLLISNDSGPVHVAAAAGTAVISLFLRRQPGINPERWRPLGEKAIVLANDPQEAVCVDKDSRVVSGRMDAITTLDVLRAGAPFLS